MGRRQDNLRAMLVEAGAKVTDRGLPTMSIHAVEASGLLQEVGSVYRALGGILPEPPARVGRWDAEIDGAALELDEMLHFNRYRGRTLRSAIYQHLGGFRLREYRRWCDEHDVDCLKAGSYGGKWTNRSCEKHFGPGGSQGDLSGPGAPRWKQRAFYDFIKDLAPVALGVPMSRLSVWQPIEYGSQRHSIGQVLDRFGPTDPAWCAALRECVRVSTFIAT